MGCTVHDLVCICFADLDHCIQQKCHTLFVPCKELYRAILASELLHVRLPPSTTCRISFQVRSPYKTILCERKYLQSLDERVVNFVDIRILKYLYLKPVRRYVIRFYIELQTEMSLTVVKTFEKTLHVFIVTGASLP